MLKIVCLVLLSVLAVSPNPIGQPCACQQYSNQAIPVVIPSNTNPYPPANTVQTPTLPAPIGNSLNQILLDKILSNPSLQKIIDPNTRLYNQNGEEVQRQARNAGTPNVINNYFIVPPEFFNLNETDVDTNKEKTKNERDSKKMLKEKKRRPKDDELALEDEEIIVKKTPIVRRKTETEGKRKKSKEKQLDVTDEFDDEEVIKRRQRENPKNERHGKRKIKPINTSEEDNDEVVVEQKLPKGKNREITRKPKSRKVIEAAPEDTVKNTRTQAKKTKNNPKTTVETLNKKVKNIEPINIFDTTTEKKQSKGCKRKPTKKERDQKTVNNRISLRERNITPFPDDATKGFFPYMPMGNYYDPYSFYPYNFNQYYQYSNPAQSDYANTNKKKPTKQEKISQEKQEKNSQANNEKNKKVNTPSKNKNQIKSDTQSNTHTIEIKIKPKKKDNITISKKPETPNSDKIKAVETVATFKNITEEKPKEPEKLIESDASIESIEVTEIPMEMPHKVSLKDVEISSTESYETFSKLENLLDFKTPELGEEDVVPTIKYNDIINDYYPRFDDDDYYNPDAENLDDRYFYETENKTRKKLDRYEDLRSQRDNSRQMLDNPDFATKKVRKVSNKDQDYDNDLATPEHDTVKSSAEIIRVKIPPKNTRPKVENVETVYAGSKVAKYGVTEESEENVSTQLVDSEEASDEIHPTYIIAKSVGRPEDYY